MCRRQLVYVFSFFFFQAEDGIRDLVRSRGLGDVYKRQGQDRGIRPGCRADRGHLQEASQGDSLCLQGAQGAVSYTHLTLPTSDLV